MTSAPAFVRYSNPLTRGLLRLGMPMGPNVLLTVRGRTSGRARSTAVAVAELDGHRWVIGAYGNVHWVRNLRAAGAGDVRLRGRTAHVQARELGLDEAQAFYAETFPVFAARLPWLGRRFIQLLFETVAPEVLRDPARAAVTRPVFELTTDGVHEPRDVQRTRSPIRAG